MKSMRKLTALLLALVMALTLAACGGKGASKTNPAVGKYIGETVLSFDKWVPMDDIYDLGENYIELKEDGTGCFMLDGDPTEIDWKLDKDGALTLDLSSLKESSDKLVVMAIANTFIQNYEAKTLELSVAGEKIGDGPMSFEKNYKKVN